MSVFGPFFEKERMEVVISFFSVTLEAKKTHEICIYVWLGAEMTIVLAGM